MARHRFIPDLALVSPATRAEETWALIAPSFKSTPRAVKDARIYNAESQTLIDVISETHDAQTLLIVGHNPSLHDLAVQLIASGDAEARAHIKENLPTSGLVVLEFSFTDWSRLHRSSGRLELFVTPRLIADANG
jgi:phosphohistidine phosphatase